MYRLRLLALLAIFFNLTSCHRESENNRQIIEDIQKSLDRSNATINRATQFVLKNLDDKTVDYCTREKALIWNARAQAATKLVKDLVDYIYELKELTTINTGLSDKLYARLEILHSELFKIDSTIQVNFPEKLLKETFSFYGLQFNKDDFYKLFKNNSGEMQQLVLSKIQNDLKISENTLIGFFDTKVSCNILTFDTYSAIIGQNSTILKPGDLLTIKAGMGVFSKSGQPKILINGRKAELGDEGYALVNIKTPIKPGSYSVPVDISFMNITTGKMDSLKVNVEYTIAKECIQ